MANTVVLCSLLILLIHPLQYAEAHIGCRDSNNKPVDWFVVYKMPRESKSASPHFKDGSAFYYLDENHQEFVLSTTSVISSNHAVFYTLSQIYKNNQSPNVLYMLYNDEPSKDSSNVQHGHTKGDLAFDKESGFWLVHSVPHFPPAAKQGYQYPKTSLEYGQTLLCVTYKYSELDVIGKQLLYYYPKIYDHNIPQIFKRENPSMCDVVKGKRVKKQPWNNTASLTSAGGETFLSFAKCAEFNKDLYLELLAPHFECELFVESWLKGKGKVMPSNCTGSYHVLNIKKIQIEQSVFMSNVDHSKWAITQCNTRPNYICIGDINRKSPQKQRGGGAVCFSLRQVWKAFTTAVKMEDPC